MVKLMGKLYKIKIIKDTEKCKIGEIVESTKKSAEQYVNSGYAEYVIEDKPKKIIKWEKENNKIQENKIDIELDNQIAYECKKCNSIIKSTTIPNKCPVCENEYFNLLTINNKDIKLEVLSFFNRKQFGDGTEILVKIILETNHIYTTKVDKAQEVFIYRDGIYVPEGEAEIKQQLRIIMEENYSEWLAGQVLAKIKTDTFISPELLFKENNIWEIAVKNGILDLINIKLIPFSPDKIFFNKMPVIYNPLLRTDKIDKFLSEILTCEDDKRVFYELAGFSLVKDYFLEKAIMFVGNGRNGKSKCIELLKKLVGADNCASVPLSSITSNSPFVQSLWRKHFNLAGDINSSDLKETAMFKQLTGRDIISANRKYKNIIQFTNYAKMVFACNDLPRVYDYSDGFWERWVLLEFPYHFVEESIYNSVDKRDNMKIKNPNILEEISGEDEMSSFLNEAIIGLHTILQNKKFTYTKGTLEVKNKWIRKADSFMAFCMDCIEEDYSCKISKNKLRSEYKKYCKKHKVIGCGDKNIKATLQENFGAGEEYSIIGDSMKQENCWTGITFKGEIYE
jgi:putative DNA primase/helicase